VGVVWQGDTFADKGSQTEIAQGSPTCAQHPPRLGTAPAPLAGDSLAHYNETSDERFITQFIHESDEEINVMSAKDVVKEGLAATEAGDFEKLETMIADDFSMSGPVPMPVGKREFIGLMMAMLKAMPDWRFNAGEYQENGDQVTVPLQISGTQTGELQLPMPGMPPIPASGKKVSLPSEPSTFTVQNGKLTKLEVESTPNGGVMGILSQLGVNMPGM
jgi:predicted ester cyclase